MAIFLRLIGYSRSLLEPLQTTTNMKVVKILFNLWGFNLYESPMLGSVLRPEEACERMGGFEESMGW